MLASLPARGHCLPGRPAVHVTAGDEADVLGTDAAGPGRRSGAVVAAVCAAAVLVASAVVLQRQEPQAAAPVFGTLTLDRIESRPLASQGALRQERDGVATGSLELTLPDGQLRGEARLEFGASLETVDGENAVTHAWGAVRLRLDAVCRGSFGWSNLVEPLEGGGSLHVRCEDGATLTAELAPTPQTQGTGVVIDLEDGWWTPGG
jgi:hypothetical protein